VNLQINDEERMLLTDLVESRMRELHPEIRRSMDHEFTDRLKHELECFQALSERLKELVSAGQ